ncbi:MAG: leucine-rich repeat domain-containing protein [Clostridia bacterium]|nr:leucine-rich repeat domain-containing protein [Clostridia bacterium]
MKRRILYGILGVMLLVTLVFSLASCDVINGLIGGGEPDKVDLSGITLPEKTVTYDGTEQSLEIVGTLPEGVTVEYENNAQVNAGKYTVIAKFYKDGEIIEGADISGILRINKASYADAMSAISFKNGSFEYDGEAHSIEITGTLPEGVTVSYEGNGKTEVGVYPVTAKFAVDTANYYPINNMSAILTIKEAAVVVPDVDLSGIGFEDKTVTYDGEAHSVEITGTLPEGVTVSYVNNAKTEAGTYIVEAQFSLNGELLEGKSLRAALVIEKAVIDMSCISFDGAVFAYDQKIHSLAISGNLPVGVEVSYLGNDQVAPGTYTVTAKFTASRNYKDIPDMTAPLTILSADADFDLIRFEDMEFLYDEAAHSITVAGQMPEGVTVEYIGNGKTEVGTYTVTAKFYYNGYYIEGQDKTAKLIIAALGGELDHIIFDNKSFVYDGTAKSIEIEGELPTNFSVYEYVGNGQVNVGEYIVTVKFAINGEYKDSYDRTATITITPASLPEINVSDVTVEFDGKAHMIECPAVELPEGVKIVSVGTAGTLPGTYSFSFGYELDESIKNNYVVGANVTVKLTIKDYASDFATAGIVYEKVTGGYAVVGYTGDAAVVIIPSTYEGAAVNSITATAFRNNKTVKNVVIPTSVTAIGQGAFGGTELEQITVPFIGGSKVTSNPYFGYIFGASGYVANEVYVPVSLKRVVIAESCTYIPAYSFRGCISLEEVVIGSGVTEIGISAFEKCTSLKSIYIPATVTEIPAAANYYNSPFFDCVDDFVIYLEAESVPTTGYGAQWNVLADGKTATVVTGISYEQYLAEKDI